MKIPYRVSILIPTVAYVIILAFPLFAERVVKKFETFTPFRQHVELFCKNQIRNPSSLFRLLEKYEQSIATIKGPKLTKMRMEKTEGGSVVTITEQKWQDGAWVNDSQSILTFETKEGWAEWLSHESGEINSASDMIQDLRWMPSVFQEQIWLAGNWESVHRMCITKNASGDVMEIQFEDWINSMWIASLLVSMDYDTNGNMTCMISKMDSDNDGDLENAINTVITYDANNLVVSSESFIWEEIISTWIPVEITRFNHDTQGNLIEKTNSFYVGGSERLTEKTSYTYDAAGNKLSETDSEYDLTAGAWTNKAKKGWQYNAVGLKTEEIQQDWDGSFWRNLERCATSYDVALNDAEWLFQTWFNSAWINDERIRNTHDGSGNCIQSLNENWLNEVWVNHFKQTSVFDGLNTPIEDISQNWMNGEWINESRFGYSYASGVAQKEPERPADFTMINYPNPFNLATTIQFNLPVQDLASVWILDIQGRVVCQIFSERTLTSGLHRLKWNGLNDSGVSVSSGVYLYQFRGDKYSTTGRCVLLK
ncbi:T9SS type A sorting domain-containing protein [candidate division KSB1 bacterium]|nr:T9SS type A sorting domain-containing protein [candidate division KSB1 bacterium]